MRKKPFNFEMIGLTKGDTIIFDPLGIEVTVASTKTIMYEGKEWLLSSFAKEYFPEKKACGTYRGPAYFSYNGRTLVDIRDEMDKLRDDDEW